MFSNLFVRIKKHENCVKSRFYCVFWLSKVAVFDQKPTKKCLFRAETSFIFGPTTKTRHFHGSFLVSFYSLILSRARERIHYL